MTGGPETLEHLDVDPALRPLARALALRGPSWWVLVQLEIRKAVDTRWGRWLLVAVLLLAVGTAVRGSTSAAVDLAHHVRSVFAVAVLVVPVVGVLATAGEWSQRTAASTFALVPQRGRVLSAKLAAAVLLTAAVSAVCALVALAAAAQAAQGAGAPVVLDGGGEAVLVALAATALATAAAAGLGAVTGSTGVGVAALAAMAAVHVGPDALGGATPWLDAHGAFEQLAGAAVTSWPQAATALTVWLVVPLAAGSARWLRRDVV